MKLLSKTIGSLVVVVGLLGAASSYAQQQKADITEKGYVGYVVMNGSDSIAVLDIAAGDVASTIPVKGNPHGGAITPDGKFIYTASMGANEMSVVDARTQKLVATIDVGNISHHTVIAPDGRYVYVAADQVVVIDSTTNTVVARIPTDEPPFYLLFSPEGRRLYVLNMGSTITVIDPNTNRAIDTLRRGADSIMGHLAFLPGGDELYVTNDVEDTVSVIDLSLKKTIATIKVGSEPHGIATTRDGKYVYVANRGGSTFSVIDASRKAIIAVKEVGRQPEHFTLTPDGKYMMLAVSTGSDRILMIDPSSFTTIEEISVWPAPHTVFFAQSSPSEL